MELTATEASAAIDPHTVFIRLSDQPRVSAHLE